MRTLRTAALALLLATPLTGCSKDADMEEFIKENNAFVDDLKKAGDAAAAKKAWDGRKDGLKKKYDAIKEARGFQVKEETKKKLEDSLVEAAKTCVMKSIGTEGIDKVCDEYEKVLELDKK